MNEGRNEWRFTLFEQSTSRCGGSRTKRLRVFRRWRSRQSPTTWVRRVGEDFRPETRKDRDRPKLPLKFPHRILAFCRDQTESYIFKNVEKCIKRILNWNEKMELIAQALLGENVLRFYDNFHNLVLHNSV